MGLTIGPPMCSYVLLFVLGSFFLFVNLERAGSQNQWFLPHEIAKEQHDLADTQLHMSRRQHDTFKTHVFCGSSYHFRKQLRLGSRGQSWFVNTMCAYAHVTHEH